MILLKEQPTLTDLHSLVDVVPRYPIKVKELLDLARHNHLPKPVIDFYSAFPEDEFFEDKDDLIARTESVEMLRHQTAPKEEMRAPEED